MSAPAFESVALADGVDAALPRVPASAGVGQILAAGGRSLVIGRASNLRRWAAGHLGRARIPKAVPGKLPPRPPTDLTPIAVTIAYATTSSPFGQRLAFERLMARHVPSSKRRDLKRPAWLRLDLDERFPRLTTQPTAAGTHVFGPFRDAKAAGKARDALYRRFRLRPCDYEFEPAADLALGLGCLYAQVESCAAPCLQRVSADEYRAIAEDAARALDGKAEEPDAAVPSWVRRAGGRSLVAERTKAAIELYPIAGGSVLDGVTAAPDGLDQAIAAIDWTRPADAADDTPWLNAWRHARHTGVEIPVTSDEAPEAVAARVRAAVVG